MDFSKIGLRPWVKEFFGSNCEHLFFQTGFFWLDFPLLKIGLSQIRFFQNWIEAMSKGCFWIKLWTFIFSKSIFFDWIFIDSKLDYLKLDFSKIRLRPWVKEFFGSSCEHLFVQNRFCVDWILFYSKLDYLKLDFPQIGLRPWIKELFGSSCKRLFFQKRFFLIGFSFIQNRIISNGFFQNWIEAMSKGIFGIKLWTFILSKSIFLIGFSFIQNWIIWNGIFPKFDGGHE